MIRSILANFELVKCCLLYYNQVNKYNQIEAASLFHSPGKNYRWPVKTVPLREFSVTHISLDYSIVDYCAILLFPTIFFLVYTFSLNLLPPFSLIRDFGKQNTHGNVSKISVRLTCYRQIGSKFTNHSPLAWRKETQKVTLASGCDWWISIRSVDNTQDGRKFWKRFRGCFVFQKLK